LAGIKSPAEAGLRISEKQHSRFCGNCSMSVLLPLDKVLSGYLLDLIARGASAFLSGELNHACAFSMLSHSETPTRLPTSLGSSKVRRRHKSGKVPQVNLRQQFCGLKLLLDVPVADDCDGKHKQC
jgi:hypothetical protein